MPDLQCVGFKINGVPFQTQDFASAQPVKCSHQNRDFQLSSADRFQKKIDLLCAVKVPPELVFLGTLDLICRVGRDQVDFNCVFQSLVDGRMIVNHRVGADPLQLLCIKLL